MFYPAQQGFPVSFLHPVRDGNGNLVAGQAANVTAALLKPDRTADGATVVTLTDYATGWVQVVLTLTLLGQYTLTLSNPDAADGRSTDYDLLVSAGVSPSETLLTSRDRVKARLIGEQGTAFPSAFDSLIDLLISEVSEEYQALLGRTFVEQDYVEYLDGSDTRSLLLGAGPIASFTALYSVEYQDDGAGGVTEALTAVPRSSYVLAGLQSQPRYYGRGRVDLVSWWARFQCGPKRFKAVYRAGLASVPEGVVGLATEDVVTRLLTRDVGHLLAKSLGDGSVTYVRPGQILEMRAERLAPYFLEAA